ncbi:MAG: hypothetical protein ACK4MX_05625 [Thermaurantiacus sp.]
MKVTPSALVLLCSLIVLAAAGVLLFRGELLWGVIMLAIAAMGLAAWKRGGPGRSA